MDLLGKTLGNYRIDRLLGKGSIGDVYQAYDLPMQRDVAFKVIHSQFARQPNFRENFPREVSAAAQMDHPGMVKVLDFGQHRDQLYVVTEYIPGPNLRELLDELIRQREWLSLNDAIRMIEQLCQTVEYAHQREAIGWDLNPTNLLLKPESANGLPFRVVLTDLRLAKLLERPENDQEEASLATPAYMSPEQVLGRTTDARSDIYSLGVLLYEFVVGIPPFPIKTLSDAVLYHSGESVPEPRSLRPDLPAGVEQVILKALDKEPENRYASAAELETALAESMRDLTQIVELEGAQDGNLFKRYEESLGAPLRTESTSLINEYESGNTELQSAFATAPAEIPPIYQIIIQVSLAGRPPQTFTFPGEMVAIGREKGNDLLLDDPKISRRHAQVTQDGSNCYVVDLNSANGTYLENIPLQPGTPTVWRPNQELRMGGASLRLMSQAQGGTVAESYNVGPRTTMERFGGEPMVATVTPQQLSVEAGAGVTATLSLLNQIPDAEYFSVSLTGIPNDWVGSLPSHVQLLPGDQKVISFTIQVPRMPQSRAGRHAITIIVANSTDPIQHVELKMTLTVAAYSQFKAELQPEHLRPEQIGRVTIANVGNFQETFTVQFTDPVGELAFEPPQLQIRIPEGRSAYADFRAQERQMRLLGGEKSHAFSAHVSTPTAEPQVLQAEVLSRGFIPVWVLPTVLLLCLFFAGTVAALWYFYFNRLDTLTVIKNGNGTVTSSPAGIDCGSICDFNFANNTKVTLNAVPLSPSTFGGWSGGGCSGTSLSCEVKISADQTITATFNPPGSQTLLINKSGTGNGIVTSSPVGIDCGSICTFAFTENTAVTLNAVPTSPSTFAGWGGACSGTSPTCTVTMNAVQSVTVTFSPPGKQTLTVTKSGTGSGTVSSSPAGVDCGSTCAFDFADNTTVTLTANPTSPSTFGGWSGGGCSGTSLTCSITMNAAQNVTATFNSPANQTLTVTKSGTGDGTVTSSPAGINCGSTCAFAFAFNTTVTLTATPTSASTFGGWSGGGCSGTSLTCSITMNAAQNVTAMFNPPGNQTLTVTKSGTGNGSVTSSPAGINCGSTCAFAFAFNTTVTLTASPTSPSTFGGWSGACSGTSPTCNVTMNQAQNVTAMFNPPGSQTLTVTKSGTGNGTVTSSPAGIDCGSTCAFAFAFNTTVTLTANPASPSTFGGWVGGGCSGTSLTCVVTMSTAQTVSATFNLPPGNQTLTVTKGGTGTGTVTSSPAGINCGSTCSSPFAFNTTVTLTANPTSPSTFGGWGGACSGTSPTCNVTMNQAQTVSATFNPPPGNQTLMVTKGGTGTGTVISSPAGIDCGSTCSSPFAFNTTVTLTASPTSSSSTFGGWGGACSSSGTSPTCNVTMNQAQTVSATFNPSDNQTLIVNKDGTGSGTVISSPAGIDCGSTCASPFAFNTTVTLTASPTSPSTFRGWGGACSSSGTSPICNVTMNQAQTVSATFNR